MPGAHSRLSPSSSHRWRNCAGAPNAEADLEDSSGYEAAEGTVFHHFAALCVDLGFDPEDFYGRKLYADYTEYADDGHRVDGEWEIEFDGEMVDSMANGLLFLRERMEAPGVIVIVERKVDLSPWLGPNEFGTSDCIIIDVLARKITVFDWKYGMIPVDPVKNDQGTLYGLGAWNTVAAALFDNDPSDIEVDIVIEQPRAQGGGGVWTTTMRRLLKEGEQIKLDAEATKGPDAPRTAGSHCKYCKRRKPGCDALDNFMIEMLDLDEDDLEMGTVVIKRTVTDEKRSTLLKNKKMVTSWLDDLYNEALEEGKQGEVVPGMKVVLGRRPARKYRDSSNRRVEATLKSELGDDMWKKDLLTPSAAEKKLGKKRFEKLLAGCVTQGDPKPTLVPDTDKRDPVEPLESMLDDLENETVDDLI